MKSQTKNKCIVLTVLEVAPLHYSTYTQDVLIEVKLELEGTSVELVELVEMPGVRFSGLWIQRILTHIKLPSLFFIGQYLKQINP